MSDESDPMIPGFVNPDPEGEPDVTRPSQAGAAPAADADEYPFLSPPVSAGDLGAMERYRLVELLGQGGMGFVFRAIDTQLERTVAFEVMKPELAVQDGARERFIREARAMAAVRSGHVITIHQVGEENGAPAGEGGAGVRRPGGGRRDAQLGAGRDRRRGLLRRVEQCQCPGGHWHFTRRFTSSMLRAREARYAVPARM